MQAASGRDAADMEETQRLLNLLKQLFRMASDFLTNWKDIAKAFLQMLKEFGEFLSGR